MKGIKLPTLVGRGKEKAAAVAEPGASAVSRFVEVTDTPKRRRLNQRLYQGVIVVCLLAGPVSCLAHPSSGSAASVPASGPVDSAVQVQVASTATSFMRQWMVASQSSAQQLLDQVIHPPQSVAFPRDAPTAPTVVEAVAVRQGNQPDVWAVTVHVAGGSAGAGEWYSVPVQATQSNGMWQSGVFALPGRTAAPGQLATDGPLSSLQPLMPGTPAVVTAVGFLNAWLSGSPTVNRWTTATYSPAAITGQLCSSVQLVSASASLADAQTLQSSSTVAAGSSLTSTSPSPQPSAAPTPTGAVTVQVVASCTTKVAVRSVQYSIGLTQNSGQWAVQSVS